MQLSLMKELTGRAVRRGLRSGDLEPLTAAILVAWNEQRDQLDGKSLFEGLAARFAPEDHGDALVAARDWLTDPGLSFDEWHFVDESLDFLQHEAIGPIDWNTEVAHCLVPDSRYANLSLSLPLARSVVRLLDPSLQGTLACLYSPSASIAWVLAEERDVTLYADQSIGMMIALFARAACRQLRVRRENPLDGSFMPAPYVHESPNHRPPFSFYDYIFSAPPFGVRVNDGPSRGMPFETFQIERLAHRARKSFWTLIPDGGLFRESKAESDLRRELATRYDTTVLSLPSGIYWPATSLQTSLVRLEPRTSNSVRMINARSMEKRSSGRVQEGLIVQHLEGFRGLRCEDVDRVAAVTLDELSENSFSLMPDRYLKSKTLSALERALENRFVVTLGDVADIERGKAPLPLREPEQAPHLTAMEIAPPDILEGIVRPPTRKQAFDLKEESRVRAVTVQPQDILVSIKGNVGIVGLVDGTEAILAGKLNDPWVVSQSLAIIRVKPNNIWGVSPTILHTMLSAPWVRDKLESMSGATTVRTLPMNSLRSLTIPIPTAEECARAEVGLEEISVLREQITHHQQDLADRQRQLWTHLWRVPINLGDD